MFSMLKNCNVRCIIYVWTVFWLSVWFCMGHTAKAITSELEYSVPQNIIQQDNDPDVVWILGLMDEYNKKLDDDDKEQYLLNIFLWSKIYRLEPKLVAAIIARESSFKKSSKSTYGAYGPMQVYTKAHRDRIKRLDLTEKEVKYCIGPNIQVGCDILREYLSYKSINGDMDKALLRYAGLYGSKKYKTNWYYEDIKYIIKTGKHPMKGNKK